MARAADSDPRSDSRLDVGQILIAESRLFVVGTLPMLLCELLSTRIRYSGFVLSLNASNALFGGAAPLVATWYLKADGVIR